MKNPSNRIKDILKPNNQYYQQDLNFRKKTFTGSCIDITNTGAQSHRLSTGNPRGGGRISLSYLKAKKLGLPIEETAFKVTGNENDLVNSNRSFEKTTKNKGLSIGGNVLST